MLARTLIIPPVRRGDSLIALLVAGCTLALYVATLQPGLGGPEDTPKFQFLGYVLGTAHPPGYPLYVLLTHVFVQLPFGTIAYRANLFSAVMAAIACAVSYIIGRQLGTGRWAAVCASFALATGLAFWKGAVFAEVYALAASIVALTIALLLSWGGTGYAGRLLAAVGTFGLGLGNHLTIVGLVPAGAWFILIRHRKALSWRLVIACAAVLLLAVSQYWFIVVRSRQASTYLESRATSLSELAAVVTAQRFANERFAFGPKALLTHQLPSVSSAIRTEMGTAGVLLLAGGLVAAIRRRNTAAILVLAAAAGLLAMVLNIAGDVAGFITPVMVLLWPVAGLGIQAIADLLATRVVVRWAMLGAAALIPVSGVASNYAASDHSRDTEDARFFRAIFTQLPGTAEIVMENYWNAMMINYLSFTEETGRPGGLWQLDSRAPTIRKAKRDGRRVFAFAGSATFLEAEGLQFQRTPLEGPLLNEWLKGLPRSSLAIGAAANVPVPIEALPIDRTRAPAVGAFRAFGSFAWVAGETDAAIEVNTARASVTRGAAVASADGRRARVDFEGHNIAEVDEGIALAVFSPAGELIRTLEFHAGEPLRVPFQGALYELTGDNPCVDVTATGWSDITPLAAAGSWVAGVDAYGPVTLETEFSGAPGIRTRASPRLGGGTIRNIGETREADGRTVVVTEFLRRDYQRPLFRFSLDRLPAAARARLRTGEAAASLKLCADQPAPLFSPHKSQATVRADFESEPYFGPGWSGAQRTGVVTVRQSAAGPSTLLLPLDADGDYRMMLNVDAARGSRLTVEANGKPAGACLIDDTAPCEIPLSRGVLRTGVNWITLTMSSASPADERAPAPLAMTFRRARIRREH